MSSSPDRAATTTTATARGSPRRSRRGEQRGAFAALGQSSSVLPRIHTVSESIFSKEFAFSEIEVVWILEVCLNLNFFLSAVVVVS